MPLGKHQVNEFKTSGVLVVEGILTQADLQPVIEAIENFLDRRAEKLLQEGKIKNLYSDTPFLTRFSRLYKQNREIDIGLDIMQMQSRPIFEFLHNQNLLDALQSILGSEITCSPIQHLRAKAPDRLNEKPNARHTVPWHQDSGVTWEEADASPIITCWIPLVDATLERGCLQVMPGISKNGHLQHHSEGGTTIIPNLLPEVKSITAEVKTGGVIFLSQFTPHSSTPNLTEYDVRWSMDLRYQVTGTHTGRPFYPDFVVHSHSNPESTLTDYNTWRQKWNEGHKYRDKYQPKTHRV